jgi:type II secretory pathway predicted ATPase ExeA/outer membrane protein OmpA-like peptidoglycan-associated protein
MYLSYYNLKEKPFQISTDPKFLWLGEKHKEALAVLKYGIQENKGFLLLTGDVGTGKTTIIHALINSLDEETTVVIVSNPDLETFDFFKFIAKAFHIEKELNSKGDFLLCFADFLHQSYRDHKKVLLVIDEAQRLNQELLEDIRLLSNIEKQHSKLLNIFLVGQDEFNETLQMPENRAFKQRITINHNIQPLTERETGEYIRHRLRIAGAVEEIFSADALHEIYSFSCGYPRVINIVCDHALLTAYVKEKKEITADVINVCAAELELPRQTSKVQPPPLAELQPPRERTFGMRAGVFTVVALVIILAGYAFYSGRIDGWITHFKKALSGNVNQPEHFKIVKVPIMQSPNEKEDISSMPNDLSLQRPDTPASKEKVMVSASFELGKLKEALVLQNNPADPQILETGEERLSDSAEYREKATNEEIQEYENSPSDKLQPVVTSPIPPATDELSQVQNSDQAPPIPTAKEPENPHKTIAPQVSQPTQGPHLVTSVSEEIQTTAAQKVEKTREDMASGISTAAATIDQEKAVPEKITEPATSEKEKPPENMASGISTAAASSDLQKSVPEKTIEAATTIDVKPPENIAPRISSTADISNQQKTVTEDIQTTAVPEIEQPAEDVATKQSTAPDQSKQENAKTDEMPTPKEAEVEDSQADRRKLIAAQVPAEPKKKQAIKYAQKKNKQYSNEDIEQILVNPKQKLLIYFKTNSNTLSTATQVTLERLAAMLSRYPSKSIMVKGFTDITGDYGKNLRLSKFRADIVKRHLVEKGVAPARILTLGEGPENPIASNKTPQGRSANRRVEIGLNIIEREKTIVPF